MQLIARLILVAVLAAFAVGSVAQAAGSAGMAAEMVASGTAAMDMADCNPCDDPEAGGMGLTCGFVCGAGSFSAVLAPQTDKFAPETGALFHPAIANDYRGLSGPPAQQPPRTLI